MSDDATVIVIPAIVVVGCNEHRREVVIDLLFAIAEIDYAVTDTSYDVIVVIATDSWIAVGSTRLTHPINSSACTSLREGSICATSIKRYYALILSSVRTTEKR